MVVIHRLHQILEPFMLRRQVQDVESRLPEKASALGPLTAASIRNLPVRGTVVSQVLLSESASTCARTHRLPVEQLHLGSRHTVLDPAHSGRSQHAP